MSPNPMIPPNFVTLRKLKELKEKREEEERLKREEEERTRKLKEEEEEQERLRKLEQEEESLRNPPKTLGSRNRYHRKGLQKRAQAPRRSANRDGQVAVKGRSTDLESSAHEESEKNQKNDGPYSRNSRAKPDAQLSRGGRPDSSANLEAQVAVNGRSEMEPATLEESDMKKKRMGKRRKNKGEQPSKWREGEVTEMPLGLNGSEAAGDGFGAPTKEKGEKITKVNVVDVNGSEGRNRFAAWKSEKEKKTRRVTVDVNGSEGSNKFGAGKNEKEKKTSRVTVDVNGSYRPGRVIGSEAGLVADIEKRVSDLKMGGGNPNSNWRGRRRGFGSWGRGGGRLSVTSGRCGSGMMWVKKTTES